MGAILLAKKFISTIKKIKPDRKAKLSFPAEIAAYREGRCAYLFFLGKKSGKPEVKMSKSPDGLDFKACQYQPEIFQKYLEEKRENQGKFDRYLGLFTSGAERLNRKNLAIEGVISDRGKSLVFYHYENEKNVFEVGAALFSKKDPFSPLWRHNQPVWKTPEDWSKKRVSFAGIIKIKERVISYWWLKEEGIFAVVYPNYKLSERIAAKSRSAQLFKPKENPIISPKADNSWEAFNTFNPAAVYQSGKVHIFYRAQGFDYVSVVGYATSKDGINIDERLDHPVFIPTQPFEEAKDIRPEEVVKSFISGGGYGGCEDPRVTKIDGRIYMTYVAFDGQNPPRIALTSISLEDFLNRDWFWKKPILISPPKVVDKCGCILPEKIRNKYVIFHRIFPNILIDFVDDLNFDGSKWLKGEYKITPRSPMWWDSRKIGAGAPPVKTKEGWLLIYEAVDDKESREYKVGAMLLDLKDPTKVLCRSGYPIIEPREKYENEGFKAGVVYPCGAVVIDKTLFVYYGGADSYVCVATAPLEKFLEELKSSGTPKMEATLIGQVA